MSFQRTRMSADRTLMSVIRTSLSLISFGFTIHQFLGKLAESSDVIKGEPAKNFGVSLVVIGVIMLILGIAYHARFMWELRKQRSAMARNGLIHGESGFPPSMTLVTAVLLLLLGLVAITGMGFRLGPFG
ncbi:DUF202 domain-containing protein [Candidimonas sp. SYP-B2681]|nr:DUF202 domain-containing protein [Candidimonas sp. SYP-B2681]